MNAFDGRYPLNQAALLVRWLLDEHGFELQRQGDSSSTRVVDDRHAISAYLVGGKGPQDWRNAPVAVRVRFGIARRDINETLHRWRADSRSGQVWTTPTVFETDKEPFIGNGLLQFGKRANLAQIAERTSQVLAQVYSWANLSDIETLMFKPGRADDTRFHRIVTDALSGRQDRSAPDLVRIRAVAAEHGPESKFGLTVRSFEAALQDFRLKYPDGIAR